MNTFPTISNAPSVSGYTVTKSNDSVIMASTASGYPVPIKIFTFDPNTWRFTLDGVTQTDKDSIDTFYEANKDVPFYWLCHQDGTTYEVIFTKMPNAQLVGKNAGQWLWQISIELRQTASC